MLIRKLHLGVRCSWTFKRSKCFQNVNGNNSDNSRSRLWTASNSFSESIKLESNSRSAILNAGSKVIDGCYTGEPVKSDYYWTPAVHIFFSAVEFVLWVEIFFSLVQKGWRPPFYENRLMLLNPWDRRPCAQIPKIDLNWQTQQMRSQHHQQSIPNINESPVKLNLTYWQKLLPIIV